MRLSLRARIFAACFAIGCGISVLFGGLSLSLLELLEFEQVDLILDDELHYLINARSEDPLMVPPRSSYVEAWVVPLPSMQGLPGDFQVLGSGISELNSQQRERRIAVADRGEFRYVVALDLTLIEPWENHAVGVVIVVMVGCILISALVGRWLANRVVTPLVQLANRVEAVPPDAATADSFGALAVGFGDDEVGRLARALDDYSELLVAYAGRERDFSSQASHELRTPVSITATSLELVLGDPSLSERSRQQLERASRALEWMKETLEALMVMARSRHGSGQVEETDLGAIVRELLPVAQSLLGDRPVRLEHDLAGNVRVAALPGALRTVVRNLLVNACSNTSRGQVRVKLEPGRLLVADTGRGLPGGDGKLLFEPFRRGEDSRGEGLGLAIVRRICEHYGWQVALSSNTQGGVDAVVTFEVAPGRATLTEA